MEFIITAFWYIAPAGFANMMPVFAARLFPSWNAPIDGGKTWRGVRIFGGHKTWRGCAAAVFGGAAAFLVQQKMAAAFPSLVSVSLFEYASMTVWFGVAQGFGACAGDALESFLKRRRGIAPGRPWVPFDQIDWALGGMAMGSMFVPLPWRVWLMVPLLAFTLSLGVKYIGFLLGIDEKKI